MININELIIKKKLLNIYTNDDIKKLNEFDNDEIDIEFINSLLSNDIKEEIDEYLKKSPNIQLGYIYIYEDNHEINEDNIKNEEKWYKIGKTISPEEILYEKREKFFTSSCYYFEQLIHKYLKAFNNSETNNKNENKLEWFFTTHKFAINVIELVLKKYDQYYEAFTKLDIKEYSGIDSFQLHNYYSKENIEKQNHIARIIYLKESICNKIMSWDLPEGLISNSTRSIDEIEVFIMNKFNKFSYKEKFYKIKNLKYNMNFIRKHLRHELKLLLITFYNHCPPNVDKIEFDEIILYLNDGKINGKFFDDATFEKIFIFIENYGIKCNWTLPYNDNVGKVQKELINSKIDLQDEIDSFTPIKDNNNNDNDNDNDNDVKDQKDLNNSLDSIGGNNQKIEISEYNKKNNIDKDQINYILELQEDITSCTSIEHDDNSQQEINNNDYINFHPNENIDKERKELKINITTNNTINTHNVKEKFMTYYRKYRDNSKTIYKSVREELNQWIVSFKDKLQKDIIEEDNKTLNYISQILCLSSYIDLSDRKLIFDCIEKYAEQCNWKININNNKSKNKFKKKRRIGKNLLNNKEVITKVNEKFIINEKEINDSIDSLLNELKYQITTGNINEQISIDKVHNLYMLLTIE